MGKYLVRFSYTEAGLKGLLKEGGSNWYRYGNPGDVMIAGRFKRDLAEFAATSIKRP